MKNVISIIIATFTTVVGDVWQSTSEGIITQSYTLVLSSQMRDGGEFGNGLHVRLFNTGSMSSP